MLKSLIRISIFSIILLSCGSSKHRMRETTYSDIVNDHNLKRFENKKISSIYVSENGQTVFINFKDSTRLVINGYKYNLRISQ